jgi:hypothetical protein
MYNMVHLNSNSTNWNQIHHVLLFVSPSLIESRPLQTHIYRAIWLVLVMSDHVLKHIRSSAPRFLSLNCQPIRDCIYLRSTCKKCLEQRYRMCLLKRDHVIKFWWRHSAGFPSRQVGEANMVGKTKVPGVFVWLITVYPINQSIPTYIVMTRNRTAGTTFMT